MLKKHEITESILKILKDKRTAEKVLLYRGEHERDFILSMLKQQDSAEKRLKIREINPDTILSECRMCPDIIERKPPFGSGSNRVMIVLNAPGMANRIEIGIHRAESVELLKKMVSAVGLDLKECYVTNLIKCETGSSLVKPSDMVKNCLKILQREIEIVKPALAIVMGDILPLQSVINSSKNIKWFNTEHTISLIKNPELKRSAWETLKMVREKILELNNDPE